ncbi:hypothetical protein D3C85_1037900 [compost metagenome]
MLLAEAHRQRVQGEGLEVELLRVEVEQARVLQRRRFGVEFEHGAAGRVGGGDHQLLVARLDVVGGEHLEIQRGVHQHHHRGAGVEAAVVVDVGARQVVVVAGRPAEVRDAAEGGVQRREHQLLAAGQAVEQGQGEAVAADRLAAAAAALLGQLGDHLLGVEQAEAVQRVDARGGDGEAAMVEADGADAAAAVALRGDLAGGGAADQAHAAEVLLQGVGEGGQVVFGAAEEQHAAQVRVHQLAGQVLGHGFRVGRLGKGHADDVVQIFFHVASGPAEHTDGIILGRRQRAGNATWVLPGPLFGGTAREAQNPSRGCWAQDG